MRRAILTIGGTAAGLAALLSFKTHPAAGVTAAGAPVPSGSTSASGPSAGSSGSSSPTRSAAPGATPGAAQATGQSGKHKSGGTRSAATRMVTGTVANTPEGPMQVQLVLTGKRITKVNVLQHTDNGQESVQVDSFALPKLTSETLTAQSARIDAVSGATYTSAGYIKSLQSAVDAAGL